MTSSSSIPVIDVRAALEGDPEALQRAAAALSVALTDVGFYFLRGHGVPSALVDSVFAAARRFHDQPLDRKMALRANRHNVGYMPVNGYVSRSSRVYTGSRPNLVEAFFVKRDLEPEHPDVVAGKRFRPLNQWPHDLPGFREVVVSYCDTMESLCKRMLPLYAIAFGLAPEFFDEAFSEPQFTLRLSHYPPSETGQSDQFGVAPHTDSSFLTMLAPSELAGLAICRPDGEWIEAPVIRDTFLVNSGDMLRRWTNERFLSTPHRVVNDNPGRHRYAIPFFFDASADYPMACLPSCQDESHPALFEPITYTDYMLWFSNQYDHVRDGRSETPADPGVPTVEQR